MVDGYQPRMKAGPLRNGCERGHGSIWHAVIGDPWMGQGALCGARPSIQWSSWQPPDARVTCPKCIKKIAALTADSTASKAEGA